MSDVGIVLVVRNGLPALRTVLHGIRDTVAPPYELAILADDCHEQDATYLLRQYLRGHITAYEIGSAERQGSHCGLDRAYRLVGGDYLLRLDDSVDLQPGWLDKAVAAMEAEPGIGCLSLVEPPDFHRKRGRPATVHVKPLACASLDMRCFITRRELVTEHERALMAEQPSGSCAFQSFLVESGFELAYLPGAARPLDVRALASAPAALALQREAGRPPHEGATGAMQRLEQAYHLGDDVLLTCMACGGTELEVLAARIIFCEAHQVAIGFWYELRCPECGELHYKDDLQFSCPG